MYSLPANTRCSLLPSGGIESSLTNGKIFRLKTLQFSGRQVALDLAYKLFRVHLAGQMPKGNCKGIRQRKFTHSRGNFRCVSTVCCSQFS